MNKEHPPRLEDQAHDYAEKLQELAYLRDQLFSRLIQLQSDEAKARFWLRTSAIMLTVSIILSTIAFFKA